LNTLTFKEQEEINKIAELFRHLSDIETFIILHKSKSKSKTKINLYERDSSILIILTLLVRLKNILNIINSNNIDNKEIEGIITKMNKILSSKKMKLFKVVLEENFKPKIFVFNPIKEEYYRINLDIIFW